MSHRLVKPLNEYSRELPSRSLTHLYTRPLRANSTKPHRCHPASKPHRCHHEEVLPHLFMRENDEGSAFCLFDPTKPFAFRGWVKGLELGAAPFDFKGAVFLMVLCLWPRARQRCRRPAVILSEPASEGSLCFAALGDLRTPSEATWYLHQTAPLSSRGSSPASLHAGERRGICFLHLTGPNPSRLEVG
jgi:hypothetical protein